MDQVSHLDISDDGKAELILAGVETMFRAKPRWSAQDTAIMREHYPKGGLAAARVLLPHKTDGAIYQQARALNLRAPGYQRQVERYFTSPHIDEAIRRYYHGTPRKGGLSKLAHQLRRPASWVSSRARQLGCVAPRFRDPAWSDAEIEIAAPPRRQDPEHDRTHLAPVRLQAHRRRGQQQARQAAVRAHRREPLFGNRARRPVRRQSARRLQLDQEGLLIAKTKGTTREHDIFSIHVRDVRRFIVENAGAIDIRRVEKHWFIDLLANGA
jgi:hypothetical protein